MPVGVQERINAMDPDTRYRWEAFKRVFPQLAGMPDQNAQAQSAADYALQLHNDLQNQLGQTPVAMPQQQPQDAPWAGSPDARGAHMQAQAGIGRNLFPMSSRPQMIDPQRAAQPDLSFPSQGRVTQYQQADPGARGSAMEQVAGGQEKQAIYLQKAMEAMQRGEPGVAAVWARLAGADQETALAANLDVQVPEQQASTGPKPMRGRVGVQMPMEQPQPRDIDTAALDQGIQPNNAAPNVFLPGVGVRPEGQITLEDLLGAVAGSANNGNDRPENYGYGVPPDIAASQPPISPIVPADQLATIPTVDRPNPQQQQMGVNYTTMPQDTPANRQVHQYNQARAMGAEVPPGVRSELFTPSPQEMNAGVGALLPSQDNLVPSVPRPAGVAQFAVPDQPGQAPSQGGTTPEQQALEILMEALRQQPAVPATPQQEAATRNSANRVGVRERQAFEDRKRIGVQRSQREQAGRDYDRRFPLGEFPTGNGSDMQGLLTQMLQQQALQQDAQFRQQDMQFKQGRAAAEDQRGQQALDLERQKVEGQLSEGGLRDRALTDPQYAYGLYWQQESAAGRAPMEFGEFARQRFPWMQMGAQGPSGPADPNDPLAGVNVPKYTTTDLDELADKSTTIEEFLDQVRPERSTGEDSIKAALVRKFGAEAVRKWFEGSGGGTMDSRDEIKKRAGKVGKRVPADAEHKAETQRRFNESQMYQGVGGMW